VVGVSWYEAVAYANWLSAKTGKNYRLPTEAEWELTCKDANRLYPWGNIWNGKFANFADLSFANEWYESEWVDTNVNDGYSSAAPVGSYLKGATPEGVMDLAGNVWEWTSSLYAPYPYYSSDGRENFSGNGERSIRGGGWGSSSTELRCTNRSRQNPDLREYNLGFRLAHD
jgi:formylglycine-generating enzyme required for sulfatase activity